MKMLQSVLFSVLFGVMLSAYAEDQSVQVDILMAKIIRAQKEGRAADALPSMAKLESMEPSLSQPLPEGFHFLYITTLDEAGDQANALRRAHIYIEKFGKRGKNYGKVIDIIGRLEEEADKNAKAKLERESQEKQECRSLLRELAQLKADYENEEVSLENRSHRAEVRKNWQHVTVKYNDLCPTYGFEAK